MRPPSSTLLYTCPSTASSFHSPLVALNTTYFYLKAKYKSAVTSDAFIFFFYKDFLVLATASIKESINTSPLFVNLSNNMYRVLHTVGSK